MGYNALQDVTKTAQPRTSLKVAQKFFFFSKGGKCTTFNIAQEIFFLKEGEKLLQHVTTSYNVLQEVTKNRQVHYFQYCSRNLFSEGRGKAVITCNNGLQCVTRC